jgi:hypothetical protein
MAVTTTDELLTVTTKKCWGPLLGPLEIDAVHHAGVVPVAVTAAYCDLLPQIRQPNIGTVAINQSLFSILANPAAFGAGKAHYSGGKVAKL